MYLLNRVLSKAVPKTPFELWTSRKPSLRHLYVLGCLAEARVHNPHESKVDSLIVMVILLVMERSKCFRFYCPNHNTRIIETENVRFT